MQACPGLKNLYSKFLPIKALLRPARSAGFRRHLRALCGHAGPVDVAPPGGRAGAGRLHLEHHRAERHLHLHQQPPEEGQRRATGGCMVYIYIYALCRQQK